MIGNLFDFLGPKRTGPPASQQDRAYGPNLRGTLKGDLARARRIDLPEAYCTARDYNERGCRSHSRKKDKLPSLMIALYLPTIRIVNEPGTGVPCPPRPPPGGGGGAGPRSCDMVNRRPVLLSKVTVRAPFIVCRFCSTSKLVGLFSWTTVIVPLPCVLKASIVTGLNAAPSEP